MQMVAGVFLQRPFGRGVIPRQIDLDAIGVGFACRAFGGYRQRVASVVRRVHFGGPDPHCLLHGSHGDRRSVVDRQGHPFHIFAEHPSPDGEESERRQVGFAWMDNQPAIGGRSDQDEGPGAVQRLEPPACDRSVDGMDRKAGRPLLDLAGGAGGGVDGPAVVQHLVVVGVAGVDAGDAVVREQPGQRLAALGEIARECVHEHDRSLWIGFRLGELVLQPVGLRRAQSKIRPPFSRRDDVEE